MGDDTVDDLLLLVLWDVINVLSLVKLSLTSAVSFRTVKNLVNINLVIAARVLISRSKWSMQVHLDLGCLLMVSAVAHLRDRVVLVASVALDEM